jgi:hypothetical protein
MRYLLVLLLFFSFISLSNDYTFESWQSNGKDCRLKFDKIPSENWDGVSELPLSVKDVSSIFRNWASENLEETESANAVSFNLASVAPEGLEQNYWVFKIGYVVFNKNVPSNFFNRKLVIELSGKVIVPKCGL